MARDTWDGDERRQSADLIRLHERLDEQNKLLAEMDKKLTAHLAAEEQLAPALADLVALWRGSKLIIPIIMGAGMLAGGLWGLISWTREHIK